MGKYIELTDDERELLVERLTACGLFVRTGDNFPSTYHTSRSGDPFVLDDRTDSSPLSNRCMAYGDKPVGAFWTALGRVFRDGTVLTSWVEWCRQNRYPLTAQVAYKIVTRPQAIVAIVTDRDDAEALAELYPAADPGRLGHAFDWAAMRADGIDGVLLTDAGLRDACAQADADWASDDEFGVISRAPIAAFESWDCTSVAWLSTRNIEVRTVLSLRPDR